MSESKFKVGDRVRVYHGLMRFDGTVKQTSTSLLAVEYELSSGEKRASEFQTQQCRKLVKRERRRVWLMRGQLEQGYGVIAAEYSQPEGNAYAEFVEVRRKAKP